MRRNSRHFQANKWNNCTKKETECGQQRGKKLENFEGEKQITPERTRLKLLTI